MRQKLNLDLTTLDRVMMLIQGPYGAGKTHLQGDFLKWAKQFGKVAFINIKGEDGYGSLSAMGLGEIAETAENLADYDSIVADYSKQGYYGVAADSLPALEDLVVRSVMPDGALRYPDPKLDGERAKMLWGQIKMLLRARVTASRSIGKVVLWVASYDKSEVEGEGKLTAPNLIGKSARASAGWFDFLGTLTADTKSPTSVTRSVSFAPSTTVLSRQRVAKTITAPIIIPEGGGGWEAIWKALLAAMPTKENK